jgi:hypothetical protein
VASVPNVKESIEIGEWEQALWGISGHKNKEMIGGWKKFLNEECLKYVLAVEHKT